MVNSLPTEIHDAKEHNATGSYDYEYVVSHTQIHENIAKHIAMASIDIVSF